MSSYSRVTCTSANNSGVPNSAVMRLRRVKIVAYLVQIGPVERTYVALDPVHLPFRVLRPLFSCAAPKSRRGRARFHTSPAPALDPSPRLAPKEGTRLVQNSGALRAVASLWRTSGLDTKKGSTYTYHPTRPSRRAHRIANPPPVKRVFALCEAANCVWACSAPRSRSSASSSRAN